MRTTATATNTITRQGGILRMDNQQDLEIELRALVSETPDAICRRLELKAFAFEEERLISDTYYCKRDCQSLDDVAMLDVGSFSLRLRSTQGGDPTGDLNVKVIISKGDHSGWQEMEVKVSSIPAMDGILTAIGFRCFLKYEKKRRSYRRGPIYAHVDEISGFDTGLELETFDRKSRKNEAIAQLEQVMEQLAIPRSQFVDKSITFLVMQRLAVF